MTPSSYRVEEKLEVLQDYVAIARHIERWTENRALADRTVDTIRSFIRSLAEYPHRGTRRDDLRENLRIVPFKRRTAIAIEIDDDARMVTVLRVFYGGQDYEAVMRDQLDRTDEEGWGELELKDGGCIFQATGQGMRRYSSSRVS